MPLWDDTVFSLFTLDSQLAIDLGVDPELCDNVLSLITSL